MIRSAFKFRYTRGEKTSHHELFAGLGIQDVIESFTQFPRMNLDERNPTL
ncbi:hypothetical protein BH20ACI3_BH20ACI3_08340 [soil metagenome]